MLLQSLNPLSTANDPLTIAVKKAVHERHGLESQTVEQGLARDVGDDISSMQKRWRNQPVDFLCLDHVMACIYGPPLIPRQLLLLM